MAPDLKNPINLLKVGISQSRRELQQAKCHASLPVHKFTHNTLFHRVGGQYITQLHKWPLLSPRVVRLYPPTYPSLTYQHPLRSKFITLRCTQYHRQYTSIHRTQQTRISQWLMAARSLILHPSCTHNHSIKQTNSTHTPHSGGRICSRHRIHTDVAT